MCVSSRKEVPTREKPNALIAVQIGFRNLSLESKLYKKDNYIIENDSFLFLLEYSLACTSLSHLPTFY